MSGTVFWFCVLYRKESAYKRYRNTVYNLISPNTVSQNDEKPHTAELQSSSQILKHLCDFPLPQCWFGYYSCLTGPKYAWLNIGEGEGQI